MDEDNLPPNAPVVAALPDEQNAGDRPPPNPPDAEDLPPAAQLVREVDRMGRVVREYNPPELAVLRGPQGDNAIVENFWSWVPVTNYPAETRGEVWRDGFNDTFVDLFACHRRIRRTRADRLSQRREYAYALWIEKDLEIRTRFYPRHWPTLTVDNVGAAKLAVHITTVLDIMDDYEGVLALDDGLQSRLERLAYLIHVYSREVVLELEGDYPALIERYRRRMSTYVHFDPTVATEASRQLPFEPLASYRIAFGYPVGRENSLIVQPPAEDHLRVICRELRAQIKPGTHLILERAQLIVDHAYEFLLMHPSTTLLQLAEEGFLGEVVAIARAAKHYFGIYETGRTPGGRGNNPGNNPCHRLYSDCEDILDRQLELMRAPILVHNPTLTYTYRDQDDAAYGPRPPFWPAYATLKHMQSRSADVTVRNPGPSFDAEPAPDYVFVPSHQEYDGQHDQRVDRFTCRRWSLSIEHEALVRFLRGMQESRTGPETLAAFEDAMATGYVEGRYPRPYPVAIARGPAPAWVQTWASGL